MCVVEGWEGERERERQIDRQIEVDREFEKLFAQQGVRRRVCVGISELKRERESRRTSDLNKSAQHS